VRFGPHELGANCEARCIVVLKPKSAGKVDKKQADGKSDAATTWKGAKPAEWEAEISWNNRDGIEADEENDARIEEILYQLSPRGPNPGKAWEFASKRSRIHGTSQVGIEDVEGPEDAPGSSEVKAKIKFASWAAPSETAKGQGEATQADKADNSQPNDPNAPAGGKPGSAHGGQGEGGGVKQAQGGFAPGQKAPSVKP
jgi:hypothetical protein